MQSFWESFADDEIKEKMKALDEELKQKMKQLSAENVNMDFTLTETRDYDFNDRWQTFAVFEDNKFAKLKKKGSNYQVYFRGGYTILYTLDEALEFIATLKRLPTFNMSCE